MNAIGVCYLCFPFVILNLSTILGFYYDETVSYNDFGAGDGCDSVHWKFIMPATCPALSKYFPSGKLLYQVVIDAGSTGSRIHIFRFSHTLRGIKLENSDFEEIEPGLSYYSTKPEKGVYSVSGLLRKALDVVPKNKWRSTPVSLRATAGLRLLPDSVAHNIIEEVRKLLIVSPFKKSDSDFISIMNGDDEGIFAWTSLNFLTGNLVKSGETLGALDLGGGSAQIVFKPMSKETILSSPETHVNTVKILGTEHDLYSYSYLGLGLMSARLAVLNFTVSANNKNGSISSSPCLLPSYYGTWSFSGNDYVVQGNMSFSYENCLHYVEKIVTNVHQPAEIVKRKFFAFSYFYDIAVSLGLVDEANGGLLSLERYIQAAKKVCLMGSYEKLDKSPFLCLDAVYITTLLRKGYGFHNSQFLQIARKINNVEVSWALGAALHMLEEYA
ncbi:ectonucleoside triphosphate diphosphohydrolase 5-like [Dendronephthya gigantea]|uniref:ectonucleoside triphosphate diphosphohydrolase 5-like n=1 Tax=Dendronephthya gigantea TaxID=151771 RepID=UPI00106B5B66|nr:ectonucleoside triphosphate diphosphohydrolase 5-like [Dendronephthya gigantea]